MRFEVLKYLLVGCNSVGAESGLVVADDEGPPWAVTAAINLTGLTQGCNAGDWCDVSVAGVKTRIESQLKGMSSFMFYSIEVKKHPFLCPCYLQQLVRFWQNDSDDDCGSDDASCFKVLTTG